MRIAGNSPWLLAAGSLLATLGIAWVAHGQLGKVHVPQGSSWPHVVSLCPDPMVDAAAYAEAFVQLEEHHIGVRSEDGACDGRAAIHIRVSEADVERLYPTTEVMGDMAELEVKSAREAFERTVIGEVIVDCTVYARYRNDAKAMVHGVLHCMGWDHPVPAPSGHVLHPRYDRMGLDDWRGVGR